MKKECGHFPFLLFVGKWFWEGAGAGGDVAVDEGTLSTAVVHVPVPVTAPKI